MKKNTLSKAVKSTLDKQAKAKEKKQYVDSLLAASKNDSANALVVEPSAGLDSAGLVSDTTSGEDVVETP